MAGNMESLLMGSDDSSSDDSDAETLQEVTAGSAVPAAAAIAATVKVAQPAPPAPALPQTRAPGSIHTQAPATVQARPVQQQQQARTMLPARTAMPPPAPAQQMTEQRSSSSSSASAADFRPLMPNRSVPATQQQQAQKRPSASVDPFEPTPLKTMIQRQQHKAAAQQAALANKQPQPATMRTPTTATTNPQQASMRSTSSTVSNASSSASTVLASNVITTDARAQAERDAKHRKERFLMFTRVLMKYLEQKDPAMHVRAKDVIRECAEKNKNKEPGYESVTASMQKRLKAMVGEHYWTRAEAYLNHFLKQKENDVQKKGQSASSSSSQPQSSLQAAQPSASSQSQQLSSSQSQSQSQPRSLHPTKTPQQIAQEREVVVTTQKKLEDIQREKEKVKQQAELLQRKQEEEKRMLELKKQQQQKEMMARMAAMEAAKQQQPQQLQQQGKNKKEHKRKSSTGSSASAVAPAAARMSPMVPADRLEKPPPREYSELMQTVDHAVDYDWTSAALLLGGDMKTNVALDGEQKRLLYGSNLAPPRQAQPLSDLPPSMRGWGKRNVLSARGAWARIRLRELREQIANDGKQNVPVVAGLKLPTAPKTNGTPEALALTPDATWFNEERAEQDKTLALMSEATEVYLKSVLQKAITAARQRENLDGIRLWHLQHGPSKPPMSLRLGCDVTRQIAQAEGNAAKTVQRMEEALERQTNVPAKARELDNAETLYNASSMSDLALRPLLASAAEEAEANAKRNFDVYGGKYSAAPPFGRVPKRPRVTKRDFVLAQEWSDYSHQKKGIASPDIL